MSGDVTDDGQAAADAAAREEALSYAAQLEASGTEDFDAFWAEEKRTGQVLRNVFGRTVTLPPSLPLLFEVEARKAQESKDPEDTKRMVGVLFGEDALDFWTERGCDIEQFSVLLMYGTANTRTPGALTLRDALDIYRARTAGGLGKEEIAQAMTSGDGSSSTGQPSKPTSVVTTNSRPQRSAA